MAPGHEPDLPDHAPTHAPRPSVPYPDLLLALSLFAVTLAVYAGVWQCGFLNYDDQVYVTANPHILGGITLSSLRWALLSFDPDNWFPLTRLSHLLDYALFGDQPAAHHAVSLLLHALASVLLFGFLRSALPSANSLSRWSAAFVAGIFALHPLHVESVVWVSERKDVLCALFWFATLWAWSRWISTASRTWYRAALLLFACGLMSKPMIVTLPALLLLLDLWPFRRPLSRTTLVDVAPFFWLSALDAALTWLAQRASGGVHLDNARSLTLRLENALVTPWIYLGKTFWPTKLSVAYSWPVAFPLWQVTAAAVALLTVSAFVLLRRRTQPWLAAGWFWFLLSLTPVLGIIQIGEQTRADRYMYVPMVGIALLIIGSAAALLASRPAFLRYAAAALATAALAACAVLTWNQVPYWRDTETLFQHAIEVDPLNYSAWLFLGNTRAAAGSVESAIGAFSTALSVRPDFVQARHRLARALFTSGRREDAIAQYQAALQTQPDYLFAHHDLGRDLLTMGRTAEALTHLETAVRLLPTWFDARFDLGNALAAQPGRLSDAIPHLQAASDLSPANPAPHYALGMALSQLPGRLSDAISHLETAEQLQPDPAVELELSRLRRLR